MIERLFQRSAAVRQAWIVLEWLERNGQDQMEDLVMKQLQYFSESTVAWENTLSSLQMGKVGPNMVRELDPDAPHRTGRQLHSLDQEDEARLVRALFGCVQCGPLEEGQELCARWDRVDRPPRWRDGSPTTTRITSAALTGRGTSCRPRGTNTGTCGRWWRGV